MTKSKKRSKKIKKENKQTRKAIFKFLPAILIMAFTGYLWVQPHISNRQSLHPDDVLAYATNISRSGLLSSTNQERSAHGVAALTMRSALNTAAQAKANDMVARNYWSHQTPDGQEPWVFIINAGYQYLAAGENLAYGFENSHSTVLGWMNSSSHKANLLNANYTEVGFGIANSPSFVGNGQNTVVVAMYGRPQPPAKSTPLTEKPAQAPSTEVKSSGNSERKQDHKQNQSQNKQQDSQPQPDPVELKTENLTDDDISMVPYSTSDDIDGSLGSNQSKSIQRVHLMTGGQAAWSAALIILLVCAIGTVWGIHRGYRLAQVIKNSKQVIGRYIHIDILILSLIFLAYILLSTSGYIQ